MFKMFVILGFYLDEMTFQLSNLFEEGGVFDWNGPALFYTRVTIGCLAASRLFFDTYYFLRVAFRGVHLLMYNLGLSKKRKGLLEESFFSSKFFLFRTILRSDDICKKKKVAICSNDTFKIA